MNEPDPSTGRIEIPHDHLAKETLREVVESYINREGTDYGLHEQSLDQKVQDVLRQLDSGEAVIVFDPDDESINILPSSHA